MKRKSCGEMSLEEFRQHIEEQEKIGKLIKTRQLVRPKTTIFSPLILAVIYLLISFFIPFALTKIFSLIKLRWLIYISSYLFFAFIFIKPLLIKSIECYQHYAKEETRRKCVCIPSCSEYSIAVLKKYNLFKAIYKILIRVFRTCGGYGYVIDEP